MLGLGAPGSLGGLCFLGLEQGSVGGVGRRTLGSGNLGFEGFGSQFEGRGFNVIGLLSGFCV